MECVVSNVYTNVEQGLSSMLEADGHTLAANRWLKSHTPPKYIDSSTQSKLKADFCACAITF